MNKHDEAMVRALVLLDRFYRQRYQVAAATRLLGMDGTSLAVEGYVRELVDFTDREYQQTRSTLLDLLERAILAGEE